MYNSVQLLLLTQQLLSSNALQLRKSQIRRKYYYNYKSKKVIYKPGERRLNCVIFNHRMLLQSKIENDTNLTNKQPQMRMRRTIKLKLNKIIATKQ